MVRLESRDELEERVTDDLKYRFRQDLIESITVVDNDEYQLKPNNQEQY